MRVFVPIYFLIFALYVAFGFVVSVGHLRYFEGLYLERSTSVRILSHCFGRFSAVFRPLFSRTWHCF